MVDKIPTQKAFEKLEEIPVEQRREAIDILVKAEIKINWGRSPGEDLNTSPLFLMWFNTTRFSKYVKDKGFLYTSSMTPALIAGR